jgi:hypothetical protein
VASYEKPDSVFQISTNGEEEKDKSDQRSGEKITREVCNDVMKEKV